MTRRRKLFIFIPFGAVFFSLGALATWIWLQYMPSTPDITNITHPIRLGEQGLVNPLLEYTTAQNQFSEIKSAENALNTQVANEAQNGNVIDVGVFFQDLNSSRWAGVNQDEAFSPASLLKVPVMLTYLKLAGTTMPHILNQTIAYDGSFDNNAREDIKPLKQIQTGHTYTIDELLKFTIGYSDNNADALLFAAGISSATFNQTYLDIGLPVPTSTNDFLSPRQYSRFFRVLYNSTYLTPSLSEKALELLALADFPQGLMAGVPENITVAQKFGEHDFPNGAKELHDCGIVYHPQRPYLLCIMTKGNDFSKLTKVIEDLSRLVWEKIDEPNSAF